MEPSGVPFHLHYAPSEGLLTAYFSAASSEQNDIYLVLDSLFGGSMFVFQALNFGKQGGNQILDEKTPTFAENKASTFIPDGFHFVFAPYKNEQTTFRLISGADANVFDSGSAYSQFVSKPKMFVAEIHLPTPLDELQIGDKFRFKGKDWTVDNISLGMGSGSLRILAGDGETMLLQEGERLNLVSSGDPDYNNKVAFSKVGDNGQFGLADPKSTIISVYDEDSFIGMKYKANEPGQNYTASQTLGGAIFTPSMVDYVHTQLGGNANELTPYKLDNGDIVDRYTIKLPGPLTIGTMTIDVPLLNPADKSILFKQSNRETYTTLINIEGKPLYYTDPECDSPLKLVIDFAKPGITCAENSRPVGSNEPQVSFSIPLMTNKYGGYQFKESDASTAKIHYSGLRGEGDYEYLVSERGTEVYVGTTDFTINYCHKPAQLQWAVEVKEGATSVRGIGISLAKPKLSVSPNPVTRDWATIGFNLPSGGEVTMEIFDALGNKISTPVNGELREAGKNSILVPTEGLSNGTYYVHLNSGPWHITEGMVITK